MNLKKLAAYGLLTLGTIGTLYHVPQIENNRGKLERSNGDLRTLNYINNTNPTEESLACTPCISELTEINLRNLENSLGYGGASLLVGLTGAAGLITRKRKKGNEGKISHLYKHDLVLLSLEIAELEESIEEEIYRSAI